MVTAVRGLQVEAKNRAELLLTASALTRNHSSVSELPAVYEATPAAVPPQGSRVKFLGGEITTEFGSEVSLRRSQKPHVKSQAWAKRQVGQS